MPSELIKKAILSTIKTCQLMRTFHSAIALLITILVVSCSKGGNSDSPIVTPPRDTAGTTPRDTTQTPPKDTTATPPKDTTGTTPPDVTTTVRVIDDLEFYEVADHSMGEVDINKVFNWGHVFLNDPAGNITFRFVPADSSDIADTVHFNKTQADMFLQYHHNYYGDDTSLTVEEAKQYDRLIATTTDKATGKVHQDIYVTKWFTAGTVHVPVFFSVRDFTLADVPKMTSALFQSDIQMDTYRMAK